MVTTKSVYQKIFSSKNSFCIQSKYYSKIASDFAPRLGQPRGGREAAERIRFSFAKSLVGALRRPPESAKKTFEFNTGVFTVPS